MVLNDIFHIIDVGLIIAVVGLILRFNSITKARAEKETELRSDTNYNRKEIERLEYEVEKLETMIIAEIKSLQSKNDKDQDTILKKFDEMDKRVQERFDKLNELMLQLMNRK